MKLALLLSLLSLSTLVNGQEYLYFKKKGTAKIKQLQLMQRAAVKESSTGKWVSGTVTAFSDSMIALDEFKVFKFTDLEAIRFGNGGWKFLSTSFKTGGVVFGGIVLVNGLINQDSFDQMSGPLLVAAGMYALGWGFDFISRKGYKLDKYRIEYISIE